MGIVIKFPGGVPSRHEMSDFETAPELISVIEHVRECNRLDCEIGRLRDVIVNMAMFGFENLPYCAG